MSEGGKIESEVTEIESPEQKAIRELAGFGLSVIPENIQAVMELMATSQHPEGYEEITKSDSLEDISRAMQEKKLRSFIHAEGPDLYTHCKLAMTLTKFMPISEEKKADLKLVMLYHDLGKANLEETSQIESVQAKELSKGKLYKVAIGHATKRDELIKNGFLANGVSGKKLDGFMKVVQNHMESQLSQLSGARLVKMFETFGRTDEERKEVAELLSMAIQVDGNACIHVKLGENGEAMVEFKDNQTWKKDFENIWQKYLAEKAGSAK